MKKKFFKHINKSHYEIWNRKKKCKHIHAVEFYIKKEIDEEGKITQTKGVKITYSQDWKAYDKAQTNEKLIFMKLLRDLCDNIEQPRYKFGRPTLPISDMLFISALRVYSTFPIRRVMSDVKIAIWFMTIPSQSRSPMLQARSSSCLRYGSASLNFPVLAAR